IRAFHVTGVQTCALPIYLSEWRGYVAGPNRGRRRWARGARTGGPHFLPRPRPGARPAASALRARLLLVRFRVLAYPRFLRAGGRSEERRVGKGRRARGRP